MTERLTPKHSDEQLSLVTREDIYELEDPEHLADLRRYLFQVAQNALDIAYEISDKLVDDDYEKKSRKRRIRRLDQEPAGSGTEA